MSEPLTGAYQPFDRPPSTDGPVVPAAHGETLDAASMNSGASVSLEPTRYTVLRPHARGGLGQVSVARDERLGRIVALKEVRPDRLDDATRRRFLTEAEITGQLEHPGIVPVYSLEQNEQGQPFYAMRFIGGHTLAQAIAAHHQSPTPLSFRDLLQRLIAVSRTIAYAHSKGVLHRDLKPANVMLGDYGETLVVDWGLAKRLATDETPAAGPPTAVASGAAGETQVGQILGTPAYMAPEQAGFHDATVGTAVDIYALGAILHEVLTGQPLYLGDNAVSILSQLEQGPPALEALAQVAPPALAAICRKAVARLPSDRYPSASAFADDVERWLADEVTSVWREPLSARAARWARRHRSFVAAAAALLLTVVVALSVGLVVIDGEREAKSRAYSLAEVQRGLADENFRQARQAVDTYFTLVSEDELLHEPGMQPLRHKLLRNALQYYQEFERRHGDEPKLKQEVAAAYLRWGIVSDELGQREEARRVLHKAIELFESLQGGTPEEEQVLAGLARSRLALARTNMVARQSDEAGKQALAAAELFEKLKRAYPGTSEYQRLLGRCYDLAAISAVRVGRIDDALTLANRCLDVHTLATRTFPDDVEAKRLHALGLNNLAGLHLFTGQVAGREAALTEALRVYEQVLRDRPDSALCRAQVVRSTMNLGRTKHDQGRLTQALDLLSANLTRVEELVRRNPTVAEYRELHNDMQMRLGESALAAGRTTTALKSLRESVAVFDKEAANAGANKSENVAWSRYLLAEVHAQRGEVEPGIALCEQSIERHEALIRQEPKNLNFPADLLFPVELRLRLRAQEGTRVEELLSAQQAIVGKRRHLAEQSPRNVFRRTETVASLLLLAEWTHQAGKPGVDALVKEGVAALEALPAETRVFPLYRQLQIRAWMLQSRMAQPLPTSAPAGKALTTAQELARQDPAYLFDLARVHAQSSAQAGEKDQARLHAGEALRALREAIVAGFDNPYLVRTDLLLEPLRTRGDFPALLRQVEEANQKGLK